MEKIFKFLTATALTLLLGLVTTIPISADEFDEEIQSSVESDEIDWNTVTQIIVLYDDGTTLSSGIIEDQKREELNNNHRVINFNSLATRSWTDYFSKVEWISYGGWTYSLSVTPKNGWTIAKESARQELRRIWLYDNHPIFKSFNNPGKVDSMYYQFVCHADFAKFKSPWNLEPLRKNVGYWPTVDAGCNPAWYE